MMQRLLRDTGIMKKILTMMILLGAVAILTAGVNAWKITLVDAKYSYMVDHRLPALTQLVRSLRHVNDGVFNGLQIITFPAGSEANRRASVDLESGPATLEDTLRQAETQDSALEPVIANFRTRAAVVFKEGLPVSSCQPAWPVGRLPGWSDTREVRFVEVFVPCSLFLAL